MKLILSVCIGIALFTSSCKKHEDSADNSVHALGAILLNTWAVGNTMHRATNVQISGGQLKGIQVNGSLTDTFTITFTGASLTLIAGNIKSWQQIPGLTKL